jgi:hypothetical protein
LRFEASVAGRDCVLKRLRFEGIRQMRTEEQEILKKFLDESERLFETEVWEETKLNELFDRCKTILRKLPEKILQKVNIRIPPDLINTDLEI